MAVILLLAAALRLYDLEHYPDWIHHDHSIVGEHARDLTWAHLSTRWYSVGGWWLALTTGAIGIFGAHFWVLRLTAALSGVVIVWLVYRLGCVTVDRTTGLYAAALAATHHVLLVYARLPYVLDPVAPLLAAFYCAVRGWQTGRLGWWVAGGLLNGAGYWAYWGAIWWVPVEVGMAGVLLLCRPWAVLARWRGIGLWLTLTLLIGPLIWGNDPAGPTAIGHTSQLLHEFVLGEQITRWTGAQWWTQIERTVGSLYRYPDAGGWGRWTSLPLLVWPEMLCLAVLACWWPPRGRLMLALSVVGVIVVLAGNVLLPTPVTFYHVLTAMPFLVLLIGAGAARLRWAGAPLILGAMTLHLLACWRGLSPPTANATMVATRWLADHRDARCVLVLPQPDSVYPPSEDARWRYVRSTPLTTDLSADCPVMIVIPPNARPVRESGHWIELPSTTGPVAIWRAP